MSAVPNHPNYYLGCDTTLGCPRLITGSEEAHGHDFKFSVSPNPSSGQIKVVYFLPQNKIGKLEVFDITGRNVYSMPLPPWSTLQLLDMSFLGDGIYNVNISSEHARVGNKILFIK